MIELLVVGTTSFVLGFAVRHWFPRPPVAPNPAALLEDLESRLDAAEGHLADLEIKSREYDRMVVAVKAARLHGGGLG